ncbi:uncharacterized protein LOC116292152 [Actinia tenebrosa]|uniref:Selenoprotein O n=1 Tax=Actinia tenebrosa TaxID=6105 RepID=A0A6P8HHG0_ACTTE|nr:uncharacterized protein LOC116292152 [Actinia tenebrosa]
MADERASKKTTRTKNRPRKIGTLFLLNLICTLNTAFANGRQHLPKSCKNSKTILEHFRNKTICLERKLVNFESWEFHETNLLLESFPIELETRNYVRQVRRAVFSFVDPTSLRTRPSIVAISQDVFENILDIDFNSVGQSDTFLDFVSGNRLINHSVPLAHRYGGHQFGEWSGQLGDGRAVLLGDYVNSKGERWELQLKGSGKTPYSRHGDGRAVLRSSIREFLASEAMHHLGIPTSRAASIAVSKDPVWRDMFYDGHPKQEKAAVVLRLAKSWFRIGSLEILTRHEETDLLRKVVDFVIDHHFPDIQGEDEDKYLKLYSKVVTMTAEMIVKWQSVGFAHGVCNTDNFSLLSITIDYGPFGFLDDYNSDFIPNSSDDEGRYSFRNQPSIGFYNLEKLLDAMSPLLDVKRGRKILQGYAEVFNNRFNDAFRKKLGLQGKIKNDDMLVKSLLWMMEVTHADYTMTFRELSNLTTQQIERNNLPEEAWALRRLAKHPNWFDWLQRYRERLDRNFADDTDEKRIQRMQSVNPRYVFRNWMAQSAIDKADKGDYSEVQKLLRILEKPFEIQAEAEAAGFALPPPPWASSLRVSCSS